MRGTKRFKAGAWRLQVWDATSRKSITATVKAPNNKTGAKEADAALRKLVDKVERGDHVTDMRMAELFTMWLRVKTPTWEPKTVDTTTSGVRHLNKQLGHAKVARLRAVHIEDCYAELSTTLSPASVRRIHGILHAALEQAKRWGLIETNPAHLVTPPRVERRHNTTPTPDQLIQLLNEVQARPDLAAFVQLASTTGARRGSVSALRWSNIDLERGTILFLNKLSVTSTGVVEQVGNKTGRQYGVAIGLDVNASLRRWRNEQREQVMRLGVPMPEDPWVFTSPLDPHNPRSPGHWSREWRRLTRRVDPTGGLDHIRLHDLKHYAATQLLAGGVPLLQVADRLGMSPALLLSLYGHAIPAADRELADVFDRIHRSGG